MKFPYLYFPHLFTVVAFFSFSPLRAQISVNFTSDRQTACAPALISFTNQSTPLAGSSFMWDFGNGKTSNAMNPQITFTDPGVFDVKLVITNNGIKDSIVKIGFVKIMDKPIAVFDLTSDTLGCAPFKAQFQNKSSDSPGAVLQYVWSFGDGSKSTLENPETTYSTAGDFDVTLLVTNQFGCSSATSEAKLIHVLKPAPQFGASATNSCTGELTVVFNNLTVSPIAYNSEWQFGNSDSSSEKDPTYHYSQPGNYTIALVVTDTFGCVNKTESTNLIRIVKTQANFTASNDTVCPGQTVYFTNQSKNANKFKWDFADGTTSSSFNAEKKFATSGDYQVKLIASNGTCTDTAHININAESVVADFSVDKPNICQLPQIVNYINNSTNAITYDWRFGNGKKASTPNPTLEITKDDLKPNSFELFFDDTLTVTSKHGCTSRKVKPRNVSVYLPKVLMDPGDGGNKKLLSGCIPMNLVFHDKSVYNNPEDSIVSRSWQLNNGPSQVTDNYATLVNTAGRLPMKLTITTARGCVHTVEEFINAGSKVTPDFEVVGNPNTCAINAVDFKVTAPNASLITAVSWDFGDNEEEGFPFPPHFYTKTGPMDVTLNVYNFGCKSTVVKRGVVNILGPVASVKASVNCDKPNEFQLEGSVMGATSFQWDFGDNSATDSLSLKPLHSYTEKGDYVVTLKTVNNQTGCSYNYMQQVKVRDIKSVIAPINENVCLNTKHQLNGSGSIDADLFVHKDVVHKYLWIFDDGTQEIFTDNPLEKTFNNKGPVRISLITKAANGCSDTVSQIVKVFHPTVEFEGNYLKGCMPVTFAFKDLSASDTTLTKWLWSFGDNTSADVQHPSHDYLSFGKYTVGLSVTDAVGCSNSLVKKQHVSAIFPSADFSVTDSTLCIGNSTRFFDTSSSQIMDYKWAFGNGTVSELVSPTVAFPDTGRFSVTLEIVDNHGCKTSRTKDHFISVQEPPIADFVADGNASSCYPFLVQFTDLSESPYLAGWKWRFGENQNVSTLQDPFFMYNKPGNHSVSLIAYTANGCSDTIVKKDLIKIKGPFAKIGLADTLCQNIQTQFVALEKMNIYDMQWDFGDGYTASGDSVWHMFDRPGNINPLLFIRTDDKNTCDKVVVDTVNILDLRARFEMLDNIAKGCVPLDVAFVNNSLNSDSWHWDLGNDLVSEVKNPKTTYPNHGIHTVSLIAKHHLGCSDTIIANAIEAFPLPTVSVSNDTVICVGDNALLRALGGINFEWSPSTNIDNPLAPTTWTKPSETTQYTVKVIDANGCVNWASTQVNVQQIPILSLTDTTIIIGESVDIDLFDEAISSYNWSPNIGLSCSNCPSPTLMPLSNIQYMIAVTDTSNCFIKTYPLNVTVLQKFSVDVPDAFSPNGDNVNDRVFVNGWGVKELLSFKIFNRFGQLVYQSQNISEGWDGTFKGMPQPIETYQYAVEVKTFTDEILSKRGTIILVR